MVVIIDYGMGNLRSVYNALNKVNCRCIISSDVTEISKAEALVLPGVGAFKDCMDNLNKSNLTNVIKEEARKGKPLLGICLGMQLLFEKGYEGKETEGLGFLKGSIVQMEDKSVKIPHIGWNRLEINNKDAIIPDFNKNIFVYYVHSYYAKDYEEDNLIAYSSYGKVKIPAIVRNNNIIGMQFHPEKSGEDGLEILKRFKELIL